MRIVNLLYASYPFALALAITYFTYTSLQTAWFAFLLWTSVTLGFAQFVALLIQRGRAAGYALPYTGRPLGLRVAAFVTSYNEEPEIVERTLLSVKAALGSRGDVYLLDDSTRPEISEELSRFCGRNGIIYMHRTDRRGFKAGAINDALRQVGDRYDLVAIFDADQRPTRQFFDVTLPFFEDPGIAFVQVPQYYEDTRSLIGQGAKYQQEPFLRRIMRGRDQLSAFSLGSGTVYRIPVLREVGYLEEDTVTEDVATSVKIHERGYRSKYVDLPLIWYGAPPTYVGSYVTQQSRWALGAFQLIPALLRSDLNFRAFADYVAGLFYWLEVGPFTLVQIAAPVAFLFGVMFLRMDPVIYVLAYVPYMAFTVLYFQRLMRGTNYGLRGFLLHQSLEYLEFPAVTASFFAWLLGRRVPFKVTPKGGRGRRSLRPLVYHEVILALLAASMIRGAAALPHAGYVQIWALGVNEFWAAWHFLFLAVGVYLSVLSMSEEEKSYVGPAPPSAPTARTADPLPLPGASSIIIPYDFSYVYS
ncbi:glycosyltransferase family 2 protein [Conexivisphaera calida]|uniref:Cellulose synthase (UDP-forming) n=1 Tax=Conexivisphaera calida TaxID=1874277 RepID=A0A4P2VBY1_9ARCH|nr:cellulose synthase catalytic subunit [Conexivisphaera calida]BBE42049.1 Cellulose synthase (UDP-forming) [Conexivisphaera calida]